MGNACFPEKVAVKEPAHRVRRGTKRYVSKRKVAAENQEAAVSRTSGLANVIDDKKKEPSHLDPDCERCVSALRSGNEFVRQSEASESRCFAAKSHVPEVECPTPKAEDDVLGKVKSISDWSVTSPPRSPTAGMRVVAGDAIPDQEAALGANSVFTAPSSLASSKGSVRAASVLCDVPLSAVEGDAIVDSHALPS
jgi:hypothetical protein